MAKARATVPADLRDRKDLTWGQMEDIAEIRERRARLQARLDGWPAKKAAIEIQIDETIAAEKEVLGETPAAAK